MISVSNVSKMNTTIYDLLFTIDKPEYRPTEDNDLNRNALNKYLTDWRIENYNSFKESWNEKVRQLIVIKDEVNTREGRTRYDVTEKMVRFFSLSLKKEIHKIEDFARTFDVESGDGMKCIKNSIVFDIRDEFIDLLENFWSAYTKAYKKEVVLLDDGNMEIKDL
jgi:hypothetical protein